MNNYGAFVYHTSITRNIILRSPSGRCCNTTQIFGLLVANNGLKMVNISVLNSTNNRRHYVVPLKGSEHICLKFNQQSPTLRGSFEKQLCFIRKCCAYFHRYCQSHIAGVRQNVVTDAEHKWEFGLIKDNPYFYFMGELLWVYCEHLGEIVYVVMAPYVYPLWCDTFPSNWVPTTYVPMSIMPVFCYQIQSVMLFNQGQKP